MRHETNANERGEPKANPSTDQPLQMTAAKTQTSLGRETSAGVTRAAASSANMIDQQLQDAVEAERLIDLELEELIRTSGASVLDGMRKTLDPEGSVLSSIRSAMAAALATTSWCARRNGWASLSSTARRSTA